ncbi:MAG: cupin domain-containing protein [Bacteroidales bacterium]|jgi:mannose-6-phosphate isomerase-like protein (cupin superfamily)|nr:cupin domain-containing protein [Bacteroidales bacterium]
MSKKDATSALFLKYSSDSEYFFEEGCFITELLNVDDDADVSVAKSRVCPGDTTKWHAVKDTSERYVILSGEGRVEIGNETPRLMKKFDVVSIPAGVRQRISNTGIDDLVFLAICTPRFVKENYVEF